MIALQAAALAVTAAGALAVVLARDPRRQALVASLYGLVLAILFVVYQAPDVALSELAVGGVALPLAVLVAAERARRHRR